VTATGLAGAPLGAGIGAAIRQIWLAASALSVAGDRRGDEASDAELVERARRDEPRALQAIYQRHAAAVYRRLTHLLGADPEREDLMQEVFADLFRQLGRFRGAALLRTYLFRIVANKAYDHLRERQRRRKRHGDDAGVAEAPGTEEQALEAVALASSPEDRVRVRQELALVGQALERLSPKKRIAYLLRVVDELSLKEIGEQVGATVFTVAQRIRHADREIRRFLEGRLP
jgi:RNA polymerase sigma-70 factor (ECF subfamily)